MTDEADQPMRILIVQHDEGGHAGRFRALLEARGIDARAILAPECPGAADWPAQDSFDALWVMGGVMQVWQTDTHPWLEGEMAFIRQSVQEAGKPYFGICFGHQLLAAACGGKARLADKREFGFLPIRGGDGVLPAGDTGVREVFQWHSAEVQTPPPGYRCGWHSTDCAVQTMKGAPGVHSVQFHPEVDVPTLRDWYAMPGTTDDLMAMGGPDQPERLMAAFEAQAGALDAMAAELLDAWLREARAG